MPSPNLPQGIVDPLNPNVQAAACLSATAYNTVGGVQGQALPDTRSDDTPTAEWRNTITLIVREFCDYVQGLAPITGLDVASFFGLPVYTTAARPAADAANEGHIIFDSTLNRIVVDIGGAWQVYLAAGDVESAVGVFGNGGLVDDTFEVLRFDENTIDVNDDGDGGCTITVNTIEIVDVDHVLYDVAFSALATNAFVDGNEVIDGRTWVTANSTNAGATWGVVSGQGVVHTTPASFSSVFTSTTQSAAYLYLPIDDVPGWTPGYPIFVDLHISASTYEQNTDRCVFGLWAPAGSPESTSASTVRAGVKGNATGTVTVGVLHQTTATMSPDAHNVTAVSVLLLPTGHVYCGYGTYSGGFPQFTYSMGANTDTTAGPSHLLAPSTRLVIAFPINSDASPTTTTTIARMRIRR
jgi:hypothetical protein